MGLINWFVKRKINKALNQKTEPELALMVDEYLKRTQKSHAETHSIAQKLNRASLMNLQTKQLKAEMQQQLKTDDDDEEDYDDEEEEEDDDFSNVLMKQIIQPNLSKFVGGTSDLPAGIKGFSASPDNISKVLEIAKTLSPTQKKMIKDKFGFDL